MMGSANVFLLLSVILSFHFGSSSNPGCRETEWKALMDFKGSLVDEGNVLSSWAGRNCCSSWYGITCHNRTGFVQMIDLSHAADFDVPLGGHVNSSLLHLEHLEYLDLSYNNFSMSPIPEFIGSLRNLQVLQLIYAGFYREIPRHLGNLSNLQHLSIIDYYATRTSYSLSSKSLNWIKTLSSLTELELEGINLSESVDWLDSINMLSSLSSLHIGRCGLVSMTLSHDLNLTSLASIYLRGNNLNSSLPPNFFNLSFKKPAALNYLDLSNNPLGPSFPHSLCTQTGLIELYVSKSGLQGPIPSCLGNLTKLATLDLGGNFLSGVIPSGLGKLTKLTDFFISQNSLVGELSESFFEGVKSLEGLDISRNFLTGHIPTFKGINKTSFTHLDLSENKLTGNIPKELGYLRSMSYLNLDNNQLTGNIPEELCYLHSMYELNLANNQLIGRIPSCLGSLVNLGTLDLGNNSLSDHIPNELGYLNSLEELHLNENKLCGEVPSSLQNLTYLITLDLGNNELHGSIPSWIGTKFLYLKYLMLQSNNFSGEIPVSLCQLPALKVLNLPDNNLVGTIPSCLGNLSMMRSYHIEHPNSFFHASNIINKGIEVEYFSDLNYAKFISLSKNHLHGEIPDELMDLVELQSLNLSNNELRGKIPERIDNMKKLESLDLSMNHLSGTIPQSLGGIDNLGYLNLSFNNLSGKIPSVAHFDTFDNLSIYEGNDELCGKPTTKSCNDVSVPSKQIGVVVTDDECDFEIEWVYAGIGPGFAVGFLGVFFLLYFKSSWRYALFRCLENVCNRI